MSRIVKVEIAVIFLLIAGCCTSEDAGISSAIPVSIDANPRKR